MKKNKVGRPTKYKPEIITKINEYLEEAIPQNMKIPTVEGIALKLGISRDTLYEWADKYPEFSDTFERLKMMQKEHLTEIGIFGGKEINATIVQLLLKVNHGMIETSKLEGILDIPQLSELGENVKRILEKK
jgi:hypothetical protein